MEIIFNHPAIYVIDYPGLDAVELFDKRSGRCGLMQGALAERFRLDFNSMVVQGADEAAVEDFVDAYSAILSLPLMRH